jgi:DNA-binding response OmpR family regulator
MRRILVVDDDPHVGQAIRVWLNHHGFRVATAESGSGGLAALDNASFWPRCSAPRAVCASRSSPPRCSP